MAFPARTPSDRSIQANQTPRLLALPHFRLALSSTSRISQLSPAGLGKRCDVAVRQGDLVVGRADRLRFRKRLEFSEPNWSLEKRLRFWHKPTVPISVV